MTRFLLSLQPSSTRNVCSKTTQTFWALLFFLAFSWSGWGQTVTIGSGTNTGNRYPISPYYNYSFSEQIIPQSEIATSGQITKLRFYWLGNSLSNSNNWTIYIGHTSKSSFSSNTDWILSSAMTQVYTGTVTTPGAAGWMEITLTGVFIYNNTDNLVIAVDENASGYNGSSSTSHFRIWTTPTNNRAIYYLSDSTNPDPSSITLTGTRTSYQNQMQIVLETPASCLPPTSLSASSITSSSANLSWTAPSSAPADGYDIYYSTSSTAPTSGTTPTVNNNAGTSYSASGLTSNTTYYWWVRSDCSGGDTSTWVSGGNFTTLCNTSTLPQTEGFNAATIPACWSTSIVAVQTGTKISYVNSGSYPTTSPQEGSHMVQYNSFSSTNGSAGSEERLRSLPLSSVGISSVDVKFYWRNENNTSYTDLNEGVQLQYSLDGSTWTNIGSFFSRHDASLAAGTAQWNEKSVTLPGAVGNQSLFYIAFKFHSEYDDNMFLDNVRILESPNCLPPASISATTSITSTAATLNWTASPSSPSSGYEWEVRSSGAGGSGATGLAVSGSVGAGVLTASASGLSPATTYTVYVRSNCGSDYSTWASGGSFTTACDIPTSQPTDLTFTSVSATSISASFTAASPAVSGYLVVRSTSATAPTPANGTTYAAASTALGAGTYVVTGNTTTSTATTFTSSGLTGNTIYYYYVFGYSNTNSCYGAPYYSSGTVLSNNTITCAPAPTGLSVGTLTSSGGTFTWTSPSGGGASVITSTINIYSNSGYSTLVYTTSGVTSPYILSSGLLSPGTTYYYQVSNSNGCASSTNGGSFTTLCSAITTFPSIFDFSTYLPSVCWNEGDGGDVNAGPTTISSTASSWAEDGYLNVTTTGSAKINIDTTGDNDWIISPEYSIPTTNYRVAYNVGATQWNNTTAPTTAWETDDFVQLLVTTSGMTNWTILKTFNDANVPSHLGQLDFTILSAYSGQTVRFAFRGVEGASDGGADIDFFIDNFTIKENPACPDPSNLTTSNILNTAATLNWDAATSPETTVSGYDYYYSTSSTAPDGSTVPSGSSASTSANISGLTASTTYYFWVRSDCTVNDSNWIAGGSFTTTNLTYVVYADPATANVNQSMDLYFIDYDAINDFYTDGQTSIWMYAGVDTSGGHWQYITGNINNTSTLLEFTRQSENPNVYKATIIPAQYFCVPSGTTVYGIDLLFENQWGPGANNQTNNLYLDLPDAAVQINIPTGVALTAVTNSSATLGWTAPTNGANEGYEYAYSTVNSAPSFGTSTSSTSIGLTGLTGSTTYYVWVRTMGCSSDASAWTSVASFTTLCDPVTSLPWTENFDAVTIPAFPSCWFKQNGDWVTTNNANDTDDADAHSGTQFLRESWSATNEFIWTPGFELTAGNSYDFSFYWAGDELSGWTGDVFYNSSQTSVGSTQLGGSFITSSTTSTLNYQKETRSFTPSSSGVYYFAIRVNASGTPWYLSFDDFRVGLTPEPITITPSTATICSGNTTTLVVSSTNSNYSYVWSPATGLDTTTGTTVNANPTVTTTYTVTATDGSKLIENTATITVNPSPTTISISEAALPVAATSCDLDYVQLSASGGNFSKTVLSENFNGVTNNWTTTNAGNGGGTPANASWTLRNSGYVYEIYDYYYDWYYNNTFTSNDNSQFYLSNSDAQDGSTSTNNTTRLVSPVFSSVGLTDMTLTFYSNYYYGTDDHAYIDVSTDGGSNWTNAVADYNNANIGTVSFDYSDYYDTDYYNVNFAQVTVNLNAYIGQSNLKIRFRYVHSYDFWWAIDNVSVAGTTQEITWAPTAGLYTDSALSTPYTGTVASTVYASPNGSQAYTATADTGICSVSTTSSTITNNSWKYVGANGGSWNTATNWAPAVVPDIAKCVKIPTGKSVVIDGTNAVGEMSTLQVGSTSSISVQAGNTLKVDSNITNDGLIEILNGASLTQVNDNAVLSGAGTYNIHKTTPTYANYDYIYWSSPVDNETIGSVFADNPVYKYEFNTANYLDVHGGGYPQTSGTVGDGYDDNGNDWSVVNAATVMAKAKGYIIMGKGSPIPFNASNIGGTQPAQSVVFDGGKVNNGVIPVTVVEDLYNTSSLTGNDSFNTNLNFLGNPYPSAIDIKALYNTNNSILTGTFYFWTHNIGIAANSGPNAYDFSNDSFATVTTNGTTIGYVLGSNTTTPADYYIPSGQGFMANVTGNGTVNFNNAMRVSGNNTDFLRTAEVEEDRLWLNLTTDQGIFRQVMVGFHESAGDGFAQGEDGPRMENGNYADFYSVISGSPYRFAIQTLAPFEISKTVPLGIEITQAGIYHINFDRGEGVFAQYQKVYLEDTYLNIIHNLTEGPYTFNSAVGTEIEDRFILRFTNDVIGIDEDTLSHMVIYPNPSKGQFYFNYRFENTASIEVYDLTGKKLSVQTTNLSDTNHMIDLSQYPSGVYYAKITDGSLQTTKKLIVE